MGSPSVSLICFCDGKLMDEDRNAKYVGGYTKLATVSTAIGFIEFKEKIHAVLKLPPNGIEFKIKCGISFDKDTLIAIDVDDDESLRSIFDHPDSKCIRAYIIKQDMPLTNIMTPRNERLNASDADAHLGENNCSKDSNDDNRGSIENPIDCMEEVSPPDILEELLAPHSIDANMHDFPGSEPCVNHDTGIETPLHDGDDFFVGQEFADVDAFKDALSNAAVRTKREYKPLKTSKSKVAVKCSSAGCNWRIRAIKVRDLPSFKVTKYPNSHTCSIHQHVVGCDHPQATIKWITSKIQSSVNENPDVAPSQIITAIEKEFGIRISYPKAVKAKTKALKELCTPFEESYGSLPGLIKELEKSGCETELGRQKDNTFHYLFWAFTACINALRNHLRPMLFVESVPIKSGILMTASGIDAEDANFYIAFGIFEEENEEWWEKFLLLMKKFIVPDIHLGLPFTIVTKYDRKTTVTVVPKLFPGVYHLFNGEDFEDLFNTIFKDENLLTWMHPAAKTWDPKDCEWNLERIKEKNEEAYQWLEKAGKTHWSNAYSESPFEEYLAFKNKIDWARVVSRLSITELIVCTRDEVARYFRDRKLRGGQMDTMFVGYAVCVMNEYISSAAARQTTTIESYGTCTDEYRLLTAERGYEFIVNLDNQTCTCRAFQAMGIPCVHAVAVVRHKGLDIRHYFKYWNTTEAYRATYACDINPIEDGWKRRTQDDTSSPLPLLLPPKRKVGRPRKRKCESPNRFKQKLDLNLLTEVPQIEEFTREDARYSQTVSTVLQHNSSRWSESTAAPSYMAYSNQSAFAKWSYGTDRIIQSPLDGTSQWLLKYILFNVPQLHTQYRDESSPKSRDGDTIPPPKPQNAYSWDRKKYYLSEIIYLSMNE